MLERGAILEAYLVPCREESPKLQQIWTALPQKSIGKGVKDFLKRLEACVSADVGHFEHNVITDITVTYKHYYL